VAFVRHLASPFGIAREVLGQQWQWEGQGQGRRQIPILILVIIPRNCQKWMTTHQTGVANKLSCQPEEGLLKVVVGLGRDIVVLKVLLSVESDSLSLHLSLLDINFVTSEDDGDVLADTDQVTYAERISKY
jgi:hypothetical protein